MPAGRPPRVGILGYQILVVDTDLRQYYHRIMTPVENIHQAQMQREDVLGNFAAVASNYVMDVKGVLAPATRTSLRRRRVNVNNLAWEWEVEMRDWAPLYYFSGRISIQRWLHG